MGIRYEKDTILNWINEMGKFLRLLVDKNEQLQILTTEEFNQEGYLHFFNKDRAFFIENDLKSLTDFVADLDIEQIRPLAQLLMYDGLMSDDQDLLKKSKFLFELNMKKSGAFSFDDYNYLSLIENRMK